MSEPALEMAGVALRYAGSDFALEIERLRLEPGHPTVLVGPSGSGKTTLLHLAAGILVADRGEVRLAGRALAGLGDRARRALRLARVGLVFQDLGLVDYLSVLDNVSLPVRLARGDLGVARDRARELLGRLGVGDLVARRASRLSGGERQRVALARALVGAPEVVLADEPTGSLDPRNARAACELLVHETERLGAALLFSTHDRSLESLASRVVSVSTVPGGPSRLEEAAP